MHTNWCVLIGISMEIGMWNFWNVINGHCTDIKISLYFPSANLPNFMKIVIWHRGKEIYDHLKEMENLPIPKNSDIYFGQYLWTKSEAFKFTNIFFFFSYSSCGYSKIGSFHFPCRSDEFINFGFNGTTNHRHCDQLGKCFSLEGV